MFLTDGLTSYTFFSTGETRTIKSNLTCDTKNLIYMIQCNRCNLQYIGETKRRLTSQPLKTKIRNFSGKYQVYIVIQR